MIDMNTPRKGFPHYRLESYDDTSYLSRLIRSEYDGEENDAPSLFPKEALMSAVAELNRLAADAARYEFLMRPPEDGTAARDRWYLLASLLERVPAARLASDGQILIDIAMEARG